MTANVLWQSFIQEVRSISSKENFIRIVNQYKNLVFSLCLKLTGDYFTAEDLTQETFLSVYQHLDRLSEDSRGETGEKAWICRIAANKCTDYLRAAARRSISTAEEELPDEAAEPGEEPLQIYLNKETEQTLKKACEELPSPYRETAIQYYSEGRTAKAIAEKEEMSVKTVQTRIRRAREMLKKKIRKEDLLA